MNIIMKYKITLFYNRVLILTYLIPLRIINIWNEFNNLNSEQMFL